MIVAAVGLAYANVLRAPFIFDDPTSITANPTIRSLWPPWAPLAAPHGGGLTVAGRPVLNFSLAVNYAISRNAVWSYHCANLAIHALAALVLFGLLRRTLCRLWTESAPAAGGCAAAAALLWALHPLQTSAVTYVIQRAESLMALFYLLTLYGFARAAAPDGARPRSWSVVSVAACLLGMGTKETMVSAPLLVLLYDRTFVSGSAREALRRRPGYYGALAATWLLLGGLVAAGGGNRGGSIGFGVGVEWWPHALTEFPALLRYLELTVWPHPLVLDYEPIWVGSLRPVALPAAVVLALIALTLRALWRRTPAGFCGALFFAVLAPSSLMPAPAEFIEEYRMYLPLAAVVTVVVAGLWRRWGRAVPAVAAGLAAICGVATAARNHDYRSAAAIWGDTVARRPDNALAHEMLGQALDAGGDRPGGLAQHVAAVQLNPDLAVAQDQLGEDLLAAGRRQEAEARFRQAIRLNAGAADPHDGLGRALAAENDLAGAIPEFEAAVRLAPDFAPARRNLALAHFQLGNAQAAAGRMAAAGAEYEAALRLDPTLADAECNLAGTLAARGETAAAIRHYRAALTLRPDFADVREALRRLEGGASPAP